MKLNFVFLLSGSKDKNHQPVLLSRVNPPLVLGAGPHKIQSSIISNLTHLFTYYS